MKQRVRNRSGENRFAQREPQMGLQTGAMTVQAAPAPAVAPTVAQPLTALELIQSAMQRGATLEQVAQLIALQERMEANEARKAFVSAMVEFKKDPPEIIKNSTADVRAKDGGRAYSYQYANLAAVVNSITKRLAEVGISHDWTPAQRGQEMSITCTITHELGHSKAATLTANNDKTGGKNDIQAVGSVASYLERYSLLAVCGIAVSDGSDNDAATGEERSEMKQEAAGMRKNARRATPADVAAARKPPATPADAALSMARAAAEKGHTEFGKYWRGLDDDTRRTLAPEMDDLTARASAAAAAGVH